MNEQRASDILRALVQGVDPFSGEPLPGHTVLQHVDVLHAILAGISALQNVQSQPRRRRRAQLPRNNGQPWSERDLEQLSTAFRNETPVAELATRHGRTVRAIEIRLEKLGLLRTVQEKSGRSQNQMGDASGVR